MDDERVRGFEVVEGGRGGGGRGGGESVIICMVGLVWVMAWKSVLVIILRIPKKKKKGKKIQENKGGELRDKRSQHKVSCFIVSIVQKTN